MPPTPAYEAELNQMLAQLDGPTCDFVGIHRRCREIAADAQTAVDCAKVNLILGLCDHKSADPKSAINHLDKVIRITDSKSELLGVRLMAFCELYVLYQATAQYSLAQEVLLDAGPRLLQSICRMQVGGYAVIVHKILQGELDTD